MIPENRTWQEEQDGARGSAVGVTWPGHAQHRGAALPACAERVGRPEASGQGGRRHHCCPLPLVKVGCRRGHTRVRAHTGTRARKATVCACTQHTCMHTWAHGHMCVHAHVHARWPCVRVHTHAHGAHVHMCTCICARKVTVCTCTHTCMHTRACMYTGTRVHVHTERRVHADTGTCAHTYSACTHPHPHSGWPQALAAAPGPAPGPSTARPPRGWTWAGWALLSLPGTAPAAPAETRSRLRGQDSGGRVPSYLGVSQGHPGRRRVMSSHPQTMCQRVSATWPLPNGRELRGAFGSCG